MTIKFGTRNVLHNASRGYISFNRISYSIVGLQSKLATVHYEEKVYLRFWINSILIGLKEISKILHRLALRRGQPSHQEIIPFWFIHCQKGAF